RTRRRSHGTAVLHGTGHAAGRPGGSAYAHATTGRGRCVALVHGAVAVLVQAVAIGIGAGSGACGTAVLNGARHAAGRARGCADTDAAAGRGRRVGLVRRAIAVVVDPITERV